MEFLQNNGFILTQKNVAWIKTSFLIKVKVGSKKYCAFWCFGWSKCMKKGRHFMVKKSAVSKRNICEICWGVYFYISVVVNPLKHQCAMQIYKNPSLVYRTGFIDASKCLKKSPQECLSAKGDGCVRDQGLSLKKFEYYLDHTSRGHFQVHWGKIVSCKFFERKPSKAFESHLKILKGIYTVVWSDYIFYRQMLCFFLHPYLRIKSKAGAYMSRHLHIKSKTSAYIRHLL